MKYAVLLYADASLDARPGAPEWEESLPAHTAFAKRLQERGLAFDGAPLHDVRAATSIRVRDGQRLVTDGPFAETKEQLWGFYTIEAPDLDTIIDACSELWESSHGTVEIRPAIPMQDG